MGLKLLTGLIPGDGACQALQQRFSSTQWHLQAVPTSSHLPSLTQGATRRNTPLKLPTHLPFSWLSPFQFPHCGLALALTRMDPVFTQTCHRTLPTLIGTCETVAIEGHGEKYEVSGYSGSFWAA